MMSRVAYDFEALAVLRFRHLGHHVLKPSAIQYFVERAELLNA